MIARTGQPAQAIAENAPEGLVGTITVEVYDPADGAPMLAASSAGITEPRPGTYRALLTPASSGRFRIRWTAGALVAEEELDVVAPNEPSSSAAGTVGQRLPSSPGHRL